MRINGHIFYQMMLSGANALENQKTAINNMNVFPVPDGDTGINMALTVSPVRKMEDSEASLSAVSCHLADAALRSARGNSGAILSLFLRGMGKAFAGQEEADAKAVAIAFDAGTKEAYKAVMQPTEGTILTVMRRCAEEACSFVKNDPNADITSLFSALVPLAETELSHTPDLLPVLKEAHVVDAGAYGFSVILAGMLSALQGQPVTATMQTDVHATTEADFSLFSSEDVIYTYCTECIIEKNEAFRGEGLTNDFRAFIGSVGDSVVFVDDEELIKLHVHTNNPGRVLEEALRYGILATVKVENMKLQHSAKVIEANESSSSVSSPKADPVNEYGFVAVCMGDGIHEAFNELGVDEVIYGGQTMNPSTQDLLEAVQRVPARTVFVFPNNKNIHLVAEQAASLCDDRTVIVLPSRNVPQGISALLAFDESATPEENKKAMIAAMSAVTCISTTHAVRDSQVDGLEIHRGQAMGMVDEKIRCVSDSEEECIARLADGIKNVTMVTVFYGNSISPEEADKVYSILNRSLSSDTEISLIKGGQPVYDYIISLE